jgi:hypothetical protein
MTKVTKGEAAVLLLACKLMEAGLTVLRPFTEDVPFDLVVNVGNRFYKIQVKRAQKVKASTMGGYEIPFRKITIGAGHRCKVYRYSKEHVDFVVGVIPETVDFYCFPVAVVEQFKRSIGVNPRGYSKFLPPTKRIVNPEQFRNVIIFDDIVVKLLPM